MKTHAPGPEWLGQRYRGVTAQGGPGPARFLGAGSYGQVYLYQDTHRDNELVAIKQLKLTGVTLQRAAELNNILPRELKNHHAMSHPYIIKFKDVLLHDASIWIVMEYATGGSLFDRVRTGASEDAARWYLQQLILALEHLHAKGIAHRDIKLDNVLLVPMSAQAQQPAAAQQAAPDKFEVRLADLGFSKQQPEGAQPYGLENFWAATNCGTVEYKAPEVFSANSANAYNPLPVDVWSAGVMLYAMLHVRYPFPRPEGTTPLPSLADMPPLQRQHNMQQGALMHPRVSVECRELLQGMLRYDPQERLTIAQIKEHPWFKPGLDTHLSNLEQQRLGQRDQPVNGKSQAELDIIIQQLRALLQPQLPHPLYEHFAQQQFIN